MIDLGFSTVTIISPLVTSGEGAGTRFSSPCALVEMTGEELRPCQAAIDKTPLDSPRRVIRQNSIQIEINSLWASQWFSRSVF
jgi:hypothetical protein